MHRCCEACTTSRHCDCAKHLVALHSCCQNASSCFITTFRLVHSSGCNSQAKTLSKSKHGRGRKDRRQLRADTSALCGSSPTVVRTEEQVLGVAEGRATHVLRPGRKHCLVAFDKTTCEGTARSNRVWCLSSLVTANPYSSCMYHIYIYIGWERRAVLLCVPSARQRPCACCLLNRYNCCSHMGTGYQIPA